MGPPWNPPESVRVCVCPAQLGSPDTEVSACGRARLCGHVYGHSFESAAALSWKLLASANRADAHSTCVGRRTPQQRYSCAAIAARRARPNRKRYTGYTPGRHAVAPTNASIDWRRVSAISPCQCAVLPGRCGCARAHRRVEGAQLRRCGGRWLGRRVVRLRCAGLLRRGRLCGRRGRQPLGEEARVWLARARVRAWRVFTFGGPAGRASFADRGVACNGTGGRTGTDRTGRTGRRLRRDA